MLVNLYLPTMILGDHHDNQDHDDDHQYDDDHQDHNHQTIITCKDPRKPT